MTPDLLRPLAASATVLAYAALCVAVFWRERRRHAASTRAAHALAADSTGPATSPVLVLFASQTGQAEALAWHTARQLHARGTPVRVLELNALEAASLRGATRALFVTSTYGEGDAPDNASLFVEQQMLPAAEAAGASEAGPAHSGHGGHGPNGGGMGDLQAAEDARPSDRPSHPVDAPATHSPLAWPGLRYAVLALGDRQYANFCGFGRQLDAWLQRQGAVREFALLEADNTDPAVLAQWQRQLGLAGDEADEARQLSAGAMARAGSERAVDAVDSMGSAPSPPAGFPAPHAPDRPLPFLPWRLAQRECLNPGSAGAPIHRLVLAPPPGVAVAWESGDLAQIAAPGDPTRPRDYSIASIASDGVVELLVREERHPDGRLGTASGWLGTTLSPGDLVPLRLRPHRTFRLGGNADRPLLLIGNGTGLAGLRAHLRARAAAGRGDHWLLFGERHARHDTLCGDEIDAWRATGRLQRLDRVFSRDQPERHYVQHRLLQAADEVTAWLERGAAVYVCGSLAGMAGGVEAALRQIAGPERFAALVAQGRYRRDVY